MSTCKAKMGEFSCGLLPLKDGLCEQHYKAITGEKSVQPENCQYDWPPANNNFDNRFIPENYSSKDMQANQIFKNRR